MKILHAVGKAKHERFKRARNINR